MKLKIGRKYLINDKSMELYRVFCCRDFYRLWMKSGDRRYPARIDELTEIPEVIKLRLKIKLYQPKPVKPEKILSEFAQLKLKNKELKKDGKKYCNKCKTTHDISNMVKSLCRGCNRDYVREYRSR